VTPQERLEFETRMRELHDAELRTLIVLRQSQYRPDVVAIARDEAARRRLIALSPNEYWSQFPSEWMATVGFCYQCWTDTTDEWPGPSLTFSGFGTRLLGHDEPCSTCGSIIQTECLCIFAPLFPLDRYRVIRTGRGQYIGKRVANPKFDSLSDCE
jgi:hypothetical protein